LVFLAFAVALAKLAALTVEDLAGEGVAAFGAVELGEDAPPVGLVVEVGEQVEGLGDPAEFGDRATGRGGSTAALQDAEDLAGADGAGGQAAGDAEQVVQELAMRSVLTRWRAIPFSGP